MAKGIIVFGGNGSGKTTLGRELAQVLKYKHIDIEDYYFNDAEIPYSAPRSREECIALMLADIEEYGSFVLSSVRGNLDEKISAMYEFAIYLSAPLEIRLERVKKRALEKFGERVLAGGDMYEQEQRFFDFVASRSLEDIERWAETVTCPVIKVDAAKPISENLEYIVSQYNMKKNFTEE
ncbi:MAG: AAA family ATPase [Clostridia bacterium]|nr:AAA family ATPase [Clostridia bacterium]